MKIFANNKAYVQNNDLAYLMRGAEGISIPTSIFEKVFGNSRHRPNKSFAKSV